MKQMVLRKGYNFVPSDEEGETTESAMEAEGHEHALHHHDYYEQLERDLRQELYETIQVSTHFGPLTGILSAVKEDYLVLVDLTNTVVLVPYNNIEFVSIV
jgi:hypothetical protein